MKRYPHYKHYKPRPSQAQIDAHHQFMMLLQEEPVEMKKLIELTENEFYYVHLILSADYVVYLDRVEHAASHASEYSSIRGEAIGRVVDKLNDA